MSDDGNQAPRSTKEGPPWKLLALLVLVVLLAVFFLQNGTDVPVEFLWLDGTWPLWTVIGISVVVGVVLDRLGTYWWRRGRRRRAYDR